MGWVGVGALIAAACFLLYHQYPSRPAVPGLSSAPPSESISANAAPASSGKAGTEEEKPKPPAKKDPSPKYKDKDEEGNTEESESTPKASASTGPTIEVPPLHLNGDINSIGSPAQIQKPPSNTPRVSPMPSPPPPQPPTASSSSLMPPPPLPRPRQQNPSETDGRHPPRPNEGNSLRPPPSAASSLRPPPSASSTLRPPPSAASSLRAPSSSRPPTNSLSPKPGTAKSSSSKRAIIEPGFSQLDWAALKTNSNNNLRGADLPPSLIKVTPSMLKAQNGRKGRDAWTSYQGKVYNISPYLPYHPGGKGELLRGAGKDSAKLFFEIHPWVNWEAILGECLVGILVSENDPVNENALDAMD